MIRLIELFSGIGAQAKALERLGLEFEHYKTCDWEVNATKSYHAVHSNDIKNHSEFYEKEELANMLYKMGVSSDGKKPMTLDSIKRKGEKWLRETYNAIKATNNLVDITKVHAKDLEIVEEDKYKYLLTYSFPCTDLSIAGKMAGMEKGSGTSSSMLWEVERILKECDVLPHYLLMENVPQVHSSKNAKAFENWLDTLQELGYVNHWADLNSKNYGVPQNRNRTFVVSIRKDIDDGSFDFPKPFKLELRLKDVLEDNVDEKYYLSPSKIKSIANWKAYQKPFERVNGKNSICPTITARGAGEDHSGMITYCDALEETTNLQEYCLNIDTINDDASVNRLGGIFDTEKSKHQAGSVYDANGIAPTLDTMQGGWRQPCIVEESLWTDVQAQMITEDGDIRRYVHSDVVDKFEEGQCADISFPNGYNKANRVHDECPAINLTTTKSSFVYKESQTPLRIRKLTPKECWRLMGFTDEDFEKAEPLNSNSSLYKQAGNSIVVDVLMVIFKQLFGGKC